MKSFEHNYVLRQPLTPALLSTVRVIGEFKGKQDMWNERFPEVLKQLQEVAIIQSTESSNRIEGVTAPPDRLRELLAQKTTPANRSEEEIAGYRDVLATIHASHEHVKVRPGVILQLHRDLYKFSAEPGGHWKQVDNEIADVRQTAPARPASAVSRPCSRPTGWNGCAATSIGCGNKRPWSRCC